MKTVILKKPGQFSLIDTAEPGPPREGEAVVRVGRVGICGTDVHAFRGLHPFFDYPRIAGHELGVEIAELGGDNCGLAVGDRCAVEPYLNCGCCAACRSGRTNCCVDLRVLGVHVDGGMRSYIKVPVSKLHKSDRLSLDQLALVETLGIGAHAVERAGIEPGESALVIGAGPIGLGVVLFCALQGAKVTVVDINEDRLAFCDQYMNVKDCVHVPPPELNPAAVFDATGNPRSMAASFGLPAHGGRLILVGMYKGSLEFDAAEYHKREMTLLATRNSTSSTFEKIIDLMQAGRIDIGPWLTHRMALAQVPDQFAQLPDQPGLIKAVIDVDRDQELR